MSLFLSRSGRFGTLNDISPYVVKVETWLRMAGVDYSSDLGMPAELTQKSPTKLIPYIILNGQMVVDSSEIIRRLEGEFSDPLGDAALSDESVTMGELTKSVCENHLFDITVYGRWMDDPTHATRAFLLRNVPEHELSEAEEMAQRRTRQRLLHRLRFYEPRQVRDQLKTVLKTLSAVLDDSLFLLGDTPSRYDTSLYGFLNATLCFPHAHAHKEIAMNFERLVAYCDHIDETYYDKTHWVDGE